MTYEPKPIDVLPLNNQLKNIMLLYPELVERLLPIKNAMEWLESAELQLYQLERNKGFEQAGELFKRDSSGLDGDNPIQGDDPHFYLNFDICRAMTALNLKRLSRHTQTLITRDRLLAAAIPHKRLMEKTTRLAKIAGKKGGQTSVIKRQPLYNEINRLFQLEKSIRPNEKMTYYAQKIEADVVVFIKNNRNEFGAIGSCVGNNSERDYYDFIYRYLQKNHSKKNKKQA